MIFAAMIEGRRSADLVMAGIKTQTWRLLTDADKFAWRDRDVVAVVRNGRCRYYEGGTYAVQSGRGKRSIGRIRLLQIILRTPSELPMEDLLAEGFTNGHAFYEALESYYGPDARFMQGVSLVFERVK